MLVTTIPNPAAFDHPDSHGPNRKYPKDHLLRVRMYLEGVHANGLMLVDIDGVLLGQMKSILKRMPFRERGLFVELLSQMKDPARRRIVQYMSVRARDGKLGDSDVREYARAVGPDLLLMPSGYVRSEGEDEDDAFAMASLEDYIDSAVETKRKALLRQHVFGRIEPGEMHALISRLTRYAKWLRFYDYYMGQVDPARLDEWTDGLGYILNIWHEEGRFGRCEGRSVALYTTARNVLDAESIRESVRVHVTNRLSRYFGVDIQLHVKRDHDRIFHARYMQTDSLAVLFDRGFDLFRPSGDVRRCAVLLADDDRGQLAEFRSLPEAMLPAPAGRAGVSVTAGEAAC